MAQYDTLKDYRFTDTADDIRGSQLYGLDGEKLGKIDDVIFDHSTGQISYVVVDTGGWLSTKKFIVSEQGIHASAKNTDDFEVNVSKKRIESLPPYNEKDLESDEQWADYEKRYRSHWEADPVGTDRNITPTTLETPGSSPAARAAKAAHGGSDLPDEDTSLDEAGFAASTDSVVIDDNAMGIGPRWDRFQELLRQRRREALDARLEDELRRAS